MACPRCRGPGRLAVIAAILAACSGSSGPGDGGTLPGFDAPPPPGLFPLGVAGDGSSLVTADGKPFLLHAEAAWSLITEPGTADVMRYLADRRGRGVDAVLVNLIEHKFADNAPRNAAGDVPFTRPGDLSAYNEAYFAHADQVIDLAASQGIAVMLTPSYLGFGGGDEGWFQEMDALPLAACQSYGDFVGKRYAARHNIIWIWGGDFTPPSGSAGEACMKAISDRIRAAEPGALASAHWQPESDSRDEPAFAGAIQLVGVYSYKPILPGCRASRASTPRMPTYLLETCYEHETIQGCAGTATEVRRRQWWGLLGCGAGEIVGNDPIWKFASGWPQQLASAVSLAEARLAAITQQVAWQTLELDDALVTTGAGQAGSTAEVAAARTADHRQAVIYIPPDGASKITVDLTRLAGAVTATWQDPTTARSVPAGTGLTASHLFGIPGNNAAGNGDWVLVLTAP
jgi:hypothetical protein